MHPVLSVFAAAALALQPQAAERPAAPPVAVAAETVPLAYETAAGVVLLRARVAGADVWALLDNGASRSFVDLDLARRQALRLEAAADRVHTATGTLAMLLARDSAFAVPGQFEARLDLPAIDLAPISAMLGRRIGAVLGADLLRHMALELKPGESRLRFARTGSITPPAGAIAVPLLNRGTQVAIEAGGRPLQVKLDLAHNGHLRVSPEVWQRIAPPGATAQASSGTNGEGGAYRTELATLPTLAVGAARIEHVPVTIGPVGEGRGDGLLGIGFLARYDVVLDLGREQLWLIPRR